MKTQTTQPTTPSLKVKTHLKAGQLTTNHNQTLVRATARRTLKTSIVAALGGLVILAALDAQAGASVANGLNFNAITSNAITSNAITSNAITSNAITSNQLTTNGLITEQQTERLPWNTLSHQGLGKTVR